MLLSLCLIFCQFQPGVAYKSVAYKIRHAVEWWSGFTRMIRRSLALARNHAIIVYRLRQRKSVILHRDITIRHTLHRGRAHFMLPSASILYMNTMNACVP